MDARDEIAENDVSVSADIIDSSSRKGAFGYNSLESVRKKLLDLTGRNQLVNYKLSNQSCVRIIDEVPDQIFEQLQAGKVFTFIPVPNPTEKELLAEGYLRKDDSGKIVKEKPEPKAEQWAKSLGLNTTYELPVIGNATDKRHNDLNIQTLMFPNELEARLRTIRSKAETAVEESGSNILYIVLGFLEWYESTNSELKRYAPLFTLPVKLERTRLDKNMGVYRYTISLKDEGLIGNITLREKLANDFDVALPEITDDSTPETYFQQLSKTVLKHEPRWKLHRMASLVVLNFTKQVMYEDLNPDNWPGGKRIENHPIIKQFFSQHSAEEETGHFETEYPIDEIENVHEAFPLIFEADSSQHSALIDAITGKNLVIEGPPGSGKSQTITNLIAACIANGKKVLFVAEKMAALEVVKRRLDTAGLGDFCLELHSHKTQKQRLLEDLQVRLNKQGQYPNPKKIDADIARYEDLKQKLNDYVSLINSTWKKTGVTIHEILIRATRYRKKLGLNPDNYRIKNINGDLLTVIRGKELLDQGEMLKSIFNQVQAQSPEGDIAHHYWYGVNNTQLIQSQQNELITHLINWNANLERLGAECQRHAEQFRIPSELMQEFKSIEICLKVSAALPDLEGGEPLALLNDLHGHSGDLDASLRKYVSLYEKLDELESQLTPKAITNTKVPAVVKMCVEKLGTLGVMETVTIADIQALYDTVDLADKEAKQLADPLSRIRNNVPDSLQDLTLGSISSLSELKTFLSLVNSLPAKLWRHRDSVYDAPEIDDVLGQMTSQFKDLLPAQKMLKEHFTLSALPDSQTLTRMHEILNDTGFFSFLSKRWRQERKHCLKLAVSAKPDRKQLTELLPRLIDYKRGLEGLDKLNTDSQVLKNLYKGLETPLDHIAALRQWYRSVRAEYGRGLGPRAKYAEALFSLNRELALALSDLSQNDFMVLLDKSLDTFKKMGDEIAYLSMISDVQCSLLNGQSPFRRVMAELHKPLLNLKQCFKLDDINLVKCRGMAKKLDKFQISASDWQNKNVIKKLRSVNLPLEIGLGKRNNQALSLANNFLSILIATEKSEALYHVVKSELSADDYQKFKQVSASLYQFYHDTQKDWDAFSVNGQVKREEWFQISEDRLDSLIHRNRDAIAHKDWLNNWLEFLALRAKLTNEGMTSILGAVERGEVQTEIVIDVINMVLMHQLSKEVLAEKPALAEFSGMEQMAVRERFCEYDKKLLKLQRKKIAFLAAQQKAPRGNASGKVSTYTDVSLIRHEAGKKRAHIAVRNLIVRAGAAIQALKPCFMMSPMSVAQYIKPGQFEFDIVVMDEASQIRPEDAIGAIARGKSLIVVGDPKQLPPTSFFEKVLNEESDEDTVALEESESILESAIPMFRTRRLRWHYRSRHESLIAFSNFHYYNSDLVIFPSPHASGSEFGIRYKEVKRGRFTRGKNVEEARVVAQAALKHLLECPDESVGLVAMNSKQQLEIEMHIEQLVKDYPEYSRAYEKNMLQNEPLFIKNLENIQGDERDVIMISMTYGPGELGGKVDQRFGPINWDVGWRRLNVLFTRSKKRMHIFSSMNAHDIQVSGTSKKGVQSLKQFLEYCEKKGHLTSPEITGREADSDFQISVIDALAEKGYTCEPQLGVAGYYLDLAVKDPVNEGSYLLGIECDGATYHSAKSARDRDRLRQEILESLGWNIKRIWSTDWFKNPNAQLQPILNELEKLTEGRAAKLDAEKEKTQHIEPDENIQALETDVIEAVPDGEKSLIDRLSDFDKNIIRKKYRNTDPDRRLLRSAMLEILINELPTSKEEFFIKVPHYLRDKTDVREAQQFLDNVLEIIGDYG